MPSLDTPLRLAVAAILIWAAVSKLTSRPAGKWLGAIGIPSGLRGALFIVAGVAETAVAALLVADVSGAAYAAVAL